MRKPIALAIAVFFTLFVSGCNSNSASLQQQQPAKQQQKQQPSKQQTTPSQNQTQPTLTPQPPKGSQTFDGGLTQLSNEQPISIAFWNTQQGLLVSSSNGHGIVWKTNDGGRSWTKVYEKDHALSRVVITGGTSAKVLVGENWGNPLSQIVTDDKGETWEKQTYQKPSFADQACAAGKFGENLFVNHSAPTSSQIWALCDGQIAAGQMAKLIVFSTDGGKTWVTRDEVTPKSQSNGLGLSGYPMGIDFLSSGRGWLWESRGYSYYTMDGGEHWRPFTNLTSPEVKEARSMSLIDDQHGYALLRDTGKYRLMFTNDGGNSWSEVQTW